MKDGQHIVLLRHGHAKKNEERRHGGAGSPLVELGRVQCQKLLATRRDLSRYFQSIIIAPRPQCRDTGTLLAQHLGLPLREAALLEPVFLGVVDGLSEVEAVTRYPDYASLLARWRAGKCEVCDLNIPGMERPDVFYTRGQRFLTECVQLGESSIVVGTRSVLVLLASVLLGRTPVIGGGYREIPWPCGEYAWFTMTHGVAELDSERSSVCLVYGDERDTD